MAHYPDILYSILEIYRRCNITYFPLDCFSLLAAYNYEVYKYSDLYKKNPLLLELCGGYSGEAFSEQNTKIVAYNERQNPQRIRFSLMHELGHIILGHRGESNQNEQEANYFASNILAPKMAIHYSSCKNHTEIAKLFNISLQAADIAFTEYRRWHRMAAYKMNFVDKEIYQHFYNKDEDKFVCFPRYCDCGAEVTNRKYNCCNHCLYIPPTKRVVQEEPALVSLFNSQKEKNIFAKAEHHWLYGNDY